MPFVKTPRRKKKARRFENDRESDGCLSSAKKGQAEVVKSLRPGVRGTTELASVESNYARGVCLESRQEWN